MTLALLFALIGYVRAFHLPGNAPREYKSGDRVDLKVSKLTSDVYQVPYEYYYLSFCPNDDGDTGASQMDESLGQILLGDAMVSTPYKLTMKQDDTCRVVCRKHMSGEEFDKFAFLIDGEYVINWLVDSLPAATKKSHTDQDSVVSESWFAGFPIGYKSGDKYYINNHASFVIKYHEPEGSSAGSGYRVVGVDVEPHSVSIQQSSGESTGEMCGDSIGFGTPMEISASGSPVLFTYSVKWEKSDVAWASRWDTYLKIKENRIHWFSIVNSLLIVLLLTGLIGLVMVRTLHRDIARYNSIIMDEESTSALDDSVNDESGWKLVHADVFRRPRHSKLLAVFIGSGVQILLMLLVSLALAAIGLVSPTQRGSYIQAMLLLYTFMGGVAGYVSARVYKMFKGEDWRTTTFMSGMVFPGVSFAVFFSVNFLLWYVDSSAAVSFSAMAILLLLWVGISIPLVYVGAYRGYAKEAIEFPVRVHHIPRQVPRQPWYSRTIVSAMIGGILPFGAVSTELVFLMGSIWHHQFYYLFGFLFLVLLILVVTCAEISMVMTYFQLTNEDYRWWWRSFLTSGFSGVYVFAYSLIYLATKLNIEGVVPIALYLGYMGLAAFSFFLLTGSVGAIASFYFVKSIYGSIKVD
jgi:transmembrane 9 superfamily member 2/4